MQCPRVHNNMYYGDFLLLVGGHRQDPCLGNCGSHYSYNRHYVKDVQRLSHVVSTQFTPSAFTKMSIPVKFHFTICNRKEHFFGGRITTWEVYILLLQPLMK